MVICTLCAANHLPKAACLIESLFHSQREHKAVLCLLERDRLAANAIDLSSVHVVLASELGIPDFDAFIFRHRMYEACGAIKAQLLLWAMGRFPEEQQFLYLDSDIYAYSRFEELDSTFQNIDVLLTPHHLHDEESVDSIRDHMVPTLMCGVYNSGFLALRRSPTSEEFLNWWNKKLMLLCYCEPEHGLYNEQRWLDMAPSFFTVSVFREQGYNVASWNVARRNLLRGAKPGSYTVDGKPLRFFHFSQIDSGMDMRHFRRDLDKSSPVFELRENYVRKIKELNRVGLSRTPWSYNCYLSGEPILDEARFAYRRIPGLASELRQPFKEENSSLLQRLARNESRPRAILRRLSALLARSK